MVTLTMAVTLKVMFPLFRINSVVLVPIGSLVRDIKCHFGQEDFTQYVS